MKSIKKKKKRIMLFCMHIRVIYVFITSGDFKYENKFLMTQTIKRYINKENEFL